MDQWTSVFIFPRVSYFQWHRTCMMFTWSLTLTAFIMILIDVDGWSHEELPHAVLGTITTIICITHPILASFRPTLGSPKRKYFNAGHAFGGAVAQILSCEFWLFPIKTNNPLTYLLIFFSVVTIFLAVNMPKAELPSWVFFILAAFVLCLMIVHFGFGVNIFGIQFVTRG